MAGFGTNADFNGINHLLQETLNFWKQTSHVMKYFRDREDPKVELPRDFMQRFLEVCSNCLITAGI